MSSVNVEKSILLFYAQKQTELMRDWINLEIQEHKISSPIERVFFSAILVLRELHCLNTENILWTDGKLVPIGLEIVPQVSIGKYRVDFLCSYIRSPDDVPKRVVVECDGHNFHDRSEPDRRYEKERDRFIQKQEFKIFRYTGSEILKEPFRCASEVIEYLTGLRCEVTSNGQN